MDQFLSKNMVGGSKGVDLSIELITKVFLVSDHL